MDNLCPFLGMLTPFTSNTSVSGFKKRRGKILGPLYFSLHEKPPFSGFCTQSWGSTWGFGCPWHCHLGRVISQPELGLGLSQKRRNRLKNRIFASVLTQTPFSQLSVQLGGLISWSFCCPCLLPTFHLFTGETQNRKETRNSKKFNLTLLTVVLAC